MMSASVTAIITTHRCPCMASADGQEATTFCVHAVSVITMITQEWMAYVEHYALSLGTCG
jgi:hypothetical protein